MADSIAKPQMHFCTDTALPAAIWSPDASNSHLSSNPTHLSNPQTHKPNTQPFTGRDNFLGQEADRSLSLMCRNCSEPRSLTALLACTGARATAARSKVAAHLDSLLDGGGCRCVGWYAVHALPAVWAHF